MATTGELKEKAEQLLAAAHQARCHKDGLSDAETLSSWRSEFGVNITDAGQGHRSDASALQILCRNELGQKLIENAFAKAALPYSVLEPASSASRDDSDKFAKILVLDARSPDVLKALDDAQYAIADAALEARWDNLAAGVANTLIGSFTDYRAANIPKVIESYLLKLTPEVIDAVKLRMSERLKENFHLQDGSPAAFSDAATRDPAIERAASDASRRVRLLLERQHQRGERCPLPLPDGERITALCDRIGEKLAERLKSDAQHVKKKLHHYPQSSDGARGR